VPHLRERVVIFLDRVGRDAVFREHQAEVAHIRNVGAEKDADVADHTGHDEGACAKTGEQRVECGGEKRRVLRFDDEIIVLFGSQDLRHFLPRATMRQRVFEQGMAVGPPAAEIFIGLTQLSTNQA